MDQPLRVTIAEEKPPYILLERSDGRFAVVERRAGKFYNLHCGKRSPEPLTEAGALHAAEHGWCDEIVARQHFDEIIVRYNDLANRIW